jgi:hypothetical protein
MRASIGHFVVCKIKGWFKRVVAVYFYWMSSHQTKSLDLFRDCCPSNVLADSISCCCCSSFFLVSFQQLNQYNYFSFQQLTGSNVDTLRYCCCCPSSIILCCLLFFIILSLFLSTTQYQMLLRIKRSVVVVVVDVPSFISFLPFRSFSTSSPLYTCSFQ